MDKKIILTLHKFRQALEGKGIVVSKIIVYGSHATGKAVKNSDIDVVIISNSFNDKNILQRLEILGSVLAKAKIYEPIEALGYTEKEYSSKRKGTFLYDEIRSTGIIIS